MSDFTVPSYRVRPQRAGVQVPWRMLAISGVVLTAAAIGGGVVWGVSRAVNRGVPTIEADERPIRTKPEDPGGLRVANQDERIFESQRRGVAGASPAQPRLTPEAERPDVAALRQAAARAQQAAAQAAAQAASQPAPALAALPSVQPDAPPSRPPLANPSLGPTAAAGPGGPSARPAAQQGVAPVPQGAVAQQAAAPQAAPPAAPPASVPAITPPALPANAPVRGGRFVVQLGAVGSEDAAQGEWARLQGRIPELAGRQPQITRVDRGDLPPMWRIRTGGLPDARAAEALCASAKAKGAPCAVIGG